MSHSPKTGFSEHLELILVKGIAGLFRLLPHRAAQKLAGAIGILFHDLVGIRKGVARTQVAAAFPEKNEKWVRHTVRCAYRSLVTVAAETARIPVLKGEEFNRWVIFEGFEEAQRILAEGKGGLIASAHLGCWEYNGAWAANLGLPVTYIVARQTNELIDRLIDETRKTVGIECVKRDRQVARGLLNALKRNRLIAMMMDQDARRQGVFVSFFGRPASTGRGLAVFALKTGAPVAVLTSRRLRDGRIHCRFRRVEFTPSGKREEDVYRLTALVTRMLEEDIRRAPDQYLWLHKRWKTRPEML